MAKCVTLKHEERVMSPITNVKLNFQMHYYFNESQATLIVLLHQGLGKGKVRENFSHFLIYGFFNFLLKAVVKQSDWWSHWCFAHPSHACSFFNREKHRKIDEAVFSFFHQR